MGTGAGQSLEMDALGEHLQRCSAATGRSFALRCSAEAVHAFMLARMVSSALLILGLVAGLAWLVL
jgi:hypothetical protein